jgi:hypothetical protein
MHAKTAIASVGVALAAAAGAAPALAAHHPRPHVRPAAHLTKAPARHAAKASPAERRIYWFRGTVVAAPAPGVSQFQVHVTMANANAWHFISRNGSILTFNSVPTTAFIAIDAAPSGRGNVPVAASIAALRAGDPVAVQIWARPGLTTRQVLAQPATKVWDFVNQVKVTGPIFRVVGKVAAVDAVGLKVTLQDAMYEGPRGAKVPLAGLVPLTFDAGTLFLNYVNRLPNLIASTGLVAGETVTASLRTTAPVPDLAALESMALWRVVHYTPVPST